MTPGESHNEWYYYYCSNFYVFNVNVDSNGSDLSSYCQRLFIYTIFQEGDIFSSIHERVRVTIICAISMLFVYNVGFCFLTFDDRILGPFIEFLSKYAIPYY